MRNWLHAADIEDGRRDGPTKSESAELREANRRIRLLEQENEVLRRAADYLSQANLPGRGPPRLVRELAGDGIPVALTCRVLEIIRQPCFRWLATRIPQA